jgi:hypothetical protein
VVLAVLPARRAVFAIQIWGDSAVVEFADRGEPIRFTRAGPQAPLVPQGDAAWSGLQVPESRRVLGPGPFPIDLGHCGLLWKVDFDGSFWLPVGELDPEAEAINGNEHGQIRLLGPNLAEYGGARGFVARLVRFPGPKHVFLCR